MSARPLEAPPDTPSLSDAELNALVPGTVVGRWTYLGSRDATTHAFEDFTTVVGAVVIVRPNDTVSGTGTSAADTPVVRYWPKSAEPTYATRPPYRGHTIAEVLSSDPDILGTEILNQAAAEGRDPQYQEVADCFPPIAKLADSTISAMETYTFVGDEATADKIGIAYGGRTANFDPAVIDPRVDAVRSAGRVLDGLVGGWLPIIRFVYPDSSRAGSTDSDSAETAPASWTEQLMFAPPRLDNANPRIQPVWYRVARVENGILQWVRYFDSYNPFPPRTDTTRVKEFLSDLLLFADAWDARSHDLMAIEIPDTRLVNQARHSLARAAMTRINDFPKYGVMDRAYGGSEHDGFQDTFTTDVAAALDWGLFDLAKRYIDNYFTNFVRHDGSLVYRGVETGQYGRMLTVVAQYYRYTGDAETLLAHRKRINAVARLLLDLRVKALDVPVTDPGHGLIAGWSEADSCLEADPSRYMRPYLANSTEAVRGFADLGAAWSEIAVRKHSGLQEFADELSRQSAALLDDVRRAIATSRFDHVDPPCLPSIAGVDRPWREAVLADKDDPQFRAYRGNMEMLYSGCLSAEDVRTVVAYRTANRDIVLGVPMAYSFHRWDEHGGNGSEMAGFLSYGHGYGLLQHDEIPAFLLELYSLSAHQYTRGTWTAPETRSLDPNRPAAPYAVPAQLAVPMLLRWALVWEDPVDDILWLGKGVPRDWLTHGHRVRVCGAPTRWGRVGFTATSLVDDGTIRLVVELPGGRSGRLPEIRIRLRLPEGASIAAALPTDPSVAPGVSVLDHRTVSLTWDRTGTIDLDIHLTRD